MAPISMDKFMEFVVPEPNSGCWIWIGPLFTNGYGSICVGGRNNRKNHLAHRVSYALHYGKYPPRAKVVMHKCDVKCCVNPEHLTLGTQYDNMRDMVTKGRHTKTRLHCRGKGNWSTKLTEKDVREIRL